MPVMETWADVQRELSRTVDPTWQTRMTDVMYHAGLTAREREVARLLIRGETLQGMAYALGISRNTAHNYMKEIYRKLDVQSGVECALALVGIRPGDA